MPRTLLIDDEPPARDLLRRLLAAHPGVEIVGEARSVADAAAQCARLRPELLFLDVQMPRADGFALLPLLAPPLPAIVFVTAHEAFAVRAFEVDAVDYLLKPVTPERLARALSRVAPPEGRSQPAAAALSFPPASSPVDTIILRTDQTIQAVPLDALTHIEAEENYTRVHLADGTAPLIRRTMAEWETLLPSARFVRVERSLIVNRGAVQRIDVVSRDVAHAHLAGRRDPLVLARRASLRLRQTLGEND